MAGETVKNVISAVSVAVAAVSVAWAAYEHGERQRFEREKLAVNQAEARAERLLELKMPFYETQLGLCVEAADAAATYATALDENAAAQARDRFEELYHGSLVLVEDQPVASAMVAYRRKLFELDGAELAARRRLAQLALAISNACRELIEESWTLDLPALRNDSD